MTTRGIDDHDIDEALWVAYRCDDKSAVTENLLLRYLPKLTFISNARADRDAVRESGGNEAALDAITAAARARTLTEPVTHAGGASGTSTT
jgi:hypothetical protein